MNHSTIAKGSDACSHRPEAADPLIAAVAADTPVARLARAAFDAILEAQLVLVSELARAAAASPEDIAGLTGRGLIVDNKGQAMAAHGLSLVPARQHRLTVRGRRFWTWCAIDAIGIPAGLGEDAVAETTCHQCGTVVRLEFQSGTLVHASHPVARVWDAQRVEGRGTACRHTPRS